MKRLYFPLVLFLMILSNVGFTQITLLSSDMPQIGDEFINANDTTNVDSILSVSVGANLSWDFSWIRNDSQDTITYVDPASTPNASTFPTATLAQAVQQGYTYFLVDQNHMEVIGGQMDTIATLFENPLTYFVFPLSYNSTFTDTGVMDISFAYDTTFSGITIDSARFKRTMYLTDTVVGWGSITTPVSTYDNVLQIKSNEEDIDSIFVHTTGYFATWMPVQNMTNTIDRWEWFTKYKNTALVSMDVSGDTIKKLSYFLEPSANIETQTIAESPITIFPNPANNIITIQSKKPVSFIQIFDMAGNCIQSYNINSQKIKTNKLNSGNYFLKSFDAHQKLIGINKFVVTH